MNSMAQQAVPKGNGQKEKRCDQSSSFSKMVVIQLSPVVTVVAFMILGTSFVPAVSLPLVTVSHKLCKLLHCRELGAHRGGGCRGLEGARRRRSGVCSGRQLDVALRRQRAARRGMPSFSARAANAR